MPTALITGASAGLGVEFAKLLAKDGHDVILVARRKDRLEALGAQLEREHGTKAWAIGADLTDPAAPAALVAEVAQLGVDVSFLINNAGFGTTGSFHTLDAAKEAGEIACNVGALVALTRAFLPGMVARGQGRVLNVASTAAFQPGPYMATYYASKAFVLSFSEALAFELQGTGVTVTASCPGPTATEFFAATGTPNLGLTKAGVMRGDAVAAAAYRAMLAGRPRIIHGTKNSLGALFVGLLPRKILMPLVAKLNLPA